MTARIKLQRGKRVEASGAAGEGDETLTIDDEVQRFTCLELRVNGVSYVVYRTRARVNGWMLVALRLKGSEDAPILFACNSDAAGLLSQGSRVPETLRRMLRILQQAGITLVSA